MKGKCHEFKQKLLISGKLLTYIDLDDDFIIEEIGKIELKGKTDKLILYGVRALADKIK